MAAIGDEIWVAAGTYVPTATPSDGYTPINQKTLTIRGGYSSDFTQRDPDTYVTIFSGDVNNNDVYNADYTAVTGNTDNAGIFKVINSIVLIDGVTLRGGYATIYSGAIWLHGGELTLVNCIFNLNLSEGWGGAFYVDGGSQLRNAGLRI